MIKKMLLCFMCMSLFLSIPGCKKAPPEVPEIPIPPTTQSITVISSSNLLYIGISETFTATATMSDGTIKAVVGGVWGGDNPTVATVEAATGKVTIVGSGTVNIFVTYGGKQGSKAIRGLPNYQGSWSGSYIIVSCSATGDWAVIDFCSLVPVGTVLPTNLVLIQDQDRVQGNFRLGQLGADTSGPVQTDGQLLLTGTIQGDITMEVSWRLQSTTPGQITGSLSQIWRMTGYSGNGQLSCNIRDLNRTSTMTLGPGAPRVMTPTLKDFIRALMRR